MRINHCPIEFHDLLEISDFLRSLPPLYAYVFDGCTVDLVSCLIMFYYHYDVQTKINYLHYKILPPKAEKFLKK